MRMVKKEVLKWIQKLDKHQKYVAKARDELDETLDEMNMLKESCDRAWSALQEARDALSELV